MLRPDQQTPSTQSCRQPPLCRRRRGCALQPSAPGSRRAIQATWSPRLQRQCRPLLPQLPRTPLSGVAAHQITLPPCLLLRQPPFAGDNTPLLEGALTALVVEVGHLIIVLVVAELVVVVLHLLRGRHLSAGGRAAQPRGAGRRTNTPKPLGSPRPPPAPQSPPWPFFEELKVRIRVRGMRGRAGVEVGADEARGKEGGSQRLQRALQGSVAQARTGRAS